MCVCVCVRACVCVRVCRGVRVNKATTKLREWRNAKVQWRRSIASRYSKRSIIMVVVWHGVQLQDVWPVLKAFL